MNNFGWNLEESKDSLDKCIKVLQSYLNKGRLALVLGAGASAALGVPMWEPLVKNCNDDLGARKINIDTSIEFDSKYYSGKFFRACKDYDEYLDIIRNNLYKNVKFDFTTTKKELLIAIMSLMVGKSRGNVDYIISYNFDDIIEWYLEINGVRINVLDENPLQKPKPDVEILHLHGFLPHPGSNLVSTNKIVFTEEEFNVRVHGTNHWKAVVKEVYKRYVFLTVGVGPGTICEDIVPGLQALSSEWYSNGNPRKTPYGIAFLTDYDEKQSEKMIDSGIIPCKMNRDNIPEAIFKIAQAAMEERGKG